MIRTRRILLTALIVLAVLLLATFVFLIRMYQPVGQVANTADAKGVEWVRSIYGWGNTRASQIGAPQSVAFAPNGTILVTDAGMARIIGFNSDGTYNSVLNRGARGSSPDAFSYPGAVAVDEQGLVYVADMTASQVVVMSPDNKFVRKIAVPRPRSLTVKGDTLVVGSSAGFVIMSKTGDAPNVLGSPGPGADQFDGVSGVAIDKNGVIYVADEYNNRVSAYNRNGTRRWIRDTGTAGNTVKPADTMVSTPSSGTAGMQLPAGITVDGAGRLVLVDAFGFNLVVLNAANGDLINRYGDAGAEDGKFVYPSAIAYDSGRDYFAIADTTMSRVQIIRIPGSGDNAVSQLNRTLLGPIRACLVPLALLFLVAVGGLVYRVIRRRKAANAGPAGPTTDGTGLGGQPA